MSVNLKVSPNEQVLPYFKVQFKFSIANWDTCNSSDTSVLKQMFGGKLPSHADKGQSKTNLTRNTCQDHYRFVSLLRYNTEGIHQKY